MEDYELEIKILSKRRKEELVSIAENLSVSTEGTKRELAERIAPAQFAERLRTWEIIAGSSAKNK